MPRPKKYHQDMKVTTLYLPENICQSLKETAKLKGCSVNELVVEILSNNLSPLEVINKRIEELEKQLEELYDLRKKRLPGW